MDNTIRIHRLELEYRKKHFKNAQDVLSSSILCAICKADLKRNIVLKKNIMVHKTFLCLCCENCFEQLSNSQNGCIFCYGKINLKDCKKCGSKMCKKCIDGFMGSANINSLNKCLRCCPRWLWSQRSQAADVLKCFSLELDTRLLVSGEESEEKQNVIKFLISSAKCNQNLSQEVIDRQRVKLVFDSFNSKIKMSLRNLTNKTTEEVKNQFNEVCDQILVDTCKAVLDLKSFFDQNNNGQLNALKKKVKSILSINNLFQNTQKDKKSLESSQSKKCLVKHLKHTDIEQNVAKASSSVSDNVNLNPEFKHEFKIKNMNVGQKSERKLNNTGIEQNIVEASNLINGNWNPIIKLERLTTKNTNGHIEPNSQRKFNYTDFKQNVAEESNTFDHKLNLIPTVKLERLNIENMNTYIPPKSKRKLTNTSIEKNVVEAPNSVNNKINLIPFVNLERLNLENMNVRIPPKSKRKLNNRDIGRNIVKASNLVNQTRSEIVDVKNMHDIRRKSNRKLNNTDNEQNSTETSDTVKDDKINLIPVVKLERLDIKNTIIRVLPKRSKRKLNGELVNENTDEKTDMLGEENADGSKRKLNVELVNENTDEKTDTLSKENADFTIEGTSSTRYKRKCRLM